MKQSIKQIRIDAPLSKQDRYYLVIKPIHYIDKEYSWRMAFSHNVTNDKSPVTRDVKYSMRIQLQGENDINPITVPYNNQNLILSGIEPVKTNEIKVAGHIGQYKSLVIVDNQFEDSPSFKIIFINEIEISGDRDSSMDTYFTKEPFYDSNINIEIWHMVYGQINYGKRT